MEKFSSSVPEGTPKKSFVDRATQRIKTAIGLGAALAGTSLTEGTLAQTNAPSSSQKSPEATVRVEKVSQQPEGVVKVEFDKKEAGFLESSDALFAEAHKACDRMKFKEEAEAFCKTYLDPLAARINGLTKEIEAYDNSRFQTLNGRVKELEGMYDTAIKLNADIATSERKQSLTRLAKTAEFAADVQDIRSGKKADDNLTKDIGAMSGKASIAGASDETLEKLKEIDPNSLPPFLKRSLLEFNEIEVLFKKLQLEAQKSISTENIVLKKVDVYKPIKPEEAERFCHEHLDPFVERINKGGIVAGNEIKKYAFDKEWAIFKRRILDGLDVMYSGLQRGAGIEVAARQTRLGKLTEFYKDVYTSAHSGADELEKMFQDIRRQQEEAKEATDKLLGPLFDKLKER